MTATANPVLDRALAHLGRYGYRGGAPRPAEVDRNPAADWARLMSDFDAPVPAFGALADKSRDAAERYLALKHDADTLLAACEAAHREFLADGIAVERTERYAVVRDAYEDKIEDFGAARVSLPAALKDG